MDDLSPLGIFLVKSGANGDRLLFKYPFEPPKDPRANTRPQNPYALVVSDDPLFMSRSASTGDVLQGNYVTISDKALSNLFACQQDLCKQKFELKINNVRFVGHPVSLQTKPDYKGSNDEKDSCTHMLNVVLALKAQASHEIVKQYHDLSKKIASAICSEEAKNGYFSRESKFMMRIHDNDADGNQSEDVSDEEHSPRKVVNPYESILKKSDLAQTLRQAFTDLCNSGALYLKINGRNIVPFCVPHKTHKLNTPTNSVQTDALEKCMNQIMTQIKPYHALLLVVTPGELVKQLSSEYRRALDRLIQCASANKNMIELGYDTDIVLESVLELTFPLVYFAHAIVIFPVKANNRYVLAPNAPTQPSHRLVTEFNTKFSCMSLASMLAEFSMPTCLSQLYNPQIHEPSYLDTLYEIVVWCLQKRILMQLHIYVYLVLPDDSSENTLIWPSKNSVISEFRESSLKSGQEQEKVSHSGDQGSDYPLIWTELNDRQQKLIEEVPAFQNAEDRALFLKLLPYFDGKNHIEHMMYCINSTSTKLMSLLEKFQDVLVTAEHADPAFNIFYR